jgi:choline dehydrogenase-like flavoprotein
MGTAKIGLDSALGANGTTVVDTTNRVYTTDNIIVADTSIFPGQVT